MVQKLKQVVCPLVCLRYMSKVPGAIPISSTSHSVSLPISKYEFRNDDSEKYEAGVSFISQLPFDIPATNQIVNVCWESGSRKWDVLVDTLFLFNISFALYFCQTFKSLLIKMSVIKPIFDPGVGYGIIVGVGAVFALGMSSVSWGLSRFFDEKQTSEMFMTAKHSVKIGLTASAVVSSWTIAATLLTSTTGK